MRIPGMATWLIGAASVAGCGGAKESAIVWPSPPDEARVVYERSVRGEDDFSGGVGAVVTTLTGDQQALRLTRPFDLCVGEEGTVYVTDVSQGTFRVDLRGGSFDLFGEKSTVELANPRGVGYGHGTVFLALASVGQVAVLTPEGEYLRSIGRPKQFPGAIDVVCDTPRSRLLLVDNNLHQVLVFSESGDSLFVIGNRGTGDGEFNYPQSAAVDAQGNIYVVDSYNFRIQVFDSSGTYVRQFGSQGDAFGMFNRPKGIALDSHANIYVLDALHQNFQIFNNDGELLMFVGKYSRGNDGFVNPVSIAIDADDRIYVADQLNGRVQIFRLLKGD